MPAFQLPPINDNPDGGWGPSIANLPEQFKFKDIPYAPYSKSDKLGRFADWNDLQGDNRQTSGQQQTQNTRTGPGGRRKDGTQAFGSGTASAFAYFHVEDESSFSLVDNKAAPPRRGGGFARGRGAARGAGGTFSRSNVRGGRGGPMTRGGANQRGGRRNWRDWEKVCLFSIKLNQEDPRRWLTLIYCQNNRTRESSVVISPQWAMLEEIEFHRLSKLRLEVEEPEEMYVRPVWFMYQYISLKCSIERVTVACTRTTRATIASPLSQRNHCNLLIVLNTTLLRLMIP